MSFWRDILGDVKRVALLHDDVRRLEGQFNRLDERVTDQGERLARIEGMIGLMRPGSSRPPRLPRG